MTWSLFVIGEVSGGRLDLPELLKRGRVVGLLVLGQSASETRTSCAGFSQIDERDASHGIRITDTSHVIRMRSRVAAGGGSGIVSLPRARVLAP
jgi:hypothetical protein